MESEEIENISGWRSDIDEIIDHLGEVGDIIHANYIYYENLFGKESLIELTQIFMMAIKQVECLDTLAKEQAHG